MLAVNLLKSLYPSADNGQIEEFSAQSSDLLASYEIISHRNRLHFFLAQLGHESGGLRIREENLNYSAKRLIAVWPSRFPSMGIANDFANDPELIANKVYGGRMGNSTAGDGWKYRGRGYIQLTGKNAYKEVGAIVGLDLISSPSLASEPKHALKVACGVWMWKKANTKCDTGDYVGLTRLINGGTVGLKDRFKWLDIVQELVAWPIASSSPVKDYYPTLDEIIYAQKKLKNAGLYSGSIDGIVGRNTRKALKIFQSEQGIGPSGKLDPATIRLLQ